MPPYRRAAQTANPIAPKEASALTQAQAAFVFVAVALTA
jgi:hypothetical protein